MKENDIGTKVYKLLIYTKSYVYNIYIGIYSIVYFIINLLVCKHVSAIIIWYKYIMLYIPKCIVYS